MRLYTFCNYYLSSIQQGIQTAHLVHELFVKYKSPSIKHDVLYDWAENHKTIVILNGGSNQDIYSKYLFLMREIDELELPFHSFCEDFNSLNSLMTCVGIIVDEKFYNSISYKTAKELIPEEIELISHEHENDYFYLQEVNGVLTVSNIFSINSPEGRLISLLKSCQLAR